MERWIPAFAEMTPRANHGLKSTALTERSSVTDTFMWSAAPDSMRHLPAHSRSDKFRAS
jgi:hypothetical protein